MSFIIKEESNVKKRVHFQLIKCENKIPNYSFMNTNNTMHSKRKKNESKISFLPDEENELFDVQWRPPMRVRAWPDPTPPQTGDHCRNWWANLLQSTEPPNLAADLKATTLDPAIAAMAAPKSLEEEWEAKDSAARNETQSQKSFVFFGFIKQRGKCWFFALEAPERVMEWAMETKSLGGLFELELTDQICGTNFFG